MAPTETEVSLDEGDLLSKTALSTVCKKLSTNYCIAKGALHLVLSNLFMHYPHDSAHLVKRTDVVLMSGSEHMHLKRCFVWQPASYEFSRDA